ncbi:MAG: DUF3558 domain-containing protein [Mycobacteriaceae bacterium]|nr:DUF3558 domain-containing protein [Mycobacteriaceae bacterium]
MKAGLVSGAVAVAVLLSGCSSSDSDGDAAPRPTTPKVSPLGPFFGECGNVSADEVAATVQEQKFPTVFRNSVGCVWQSAIDLSAPTVSFSWYRGSPIDRESAGSGLIGRPPEKVDIEGHKGFRGTDGAGLCEVGLQYGDDFYHWSVSYGMQGVSTDPCQAATKLATMTAQRVK